MNKILSKYGIVFIWLLLLFPAVSLADGKVIKISDGDTLTILDKSKRQIKVRLAEIDTPESGQPYGNKSKETLSKLVFGKTVRVQVQDIDRYGRTVARIYVNGLDVNVEMVKLGAAWVYRQYCKDKALYQIENDARANKTGLWAFPEAERMPPWEWRRVKRKGKPVKTTSNNPVVNLK